MSPDSMESLFAQLSHYLVEENFSVNDWQVVAAEFGVSSTAENTPGVPHGRDDTVDRRNSYIV